MRNTSIKICSLALFCGIFGAFIRWLQIMIAFEPETGLVTPFKPISIIFLIYIGINAILAAFAVRSLKIKEAPTSYPKCVSAGGNIFSLGAKIIGVIMGLGGAVSIITSVVSRDLFQLISGILALATAPAVGSFLGSASKHGAKKRGRFCATFTTVFICFWLISTYKFSSSDPVLWNFAPRLVAIALLLLSSYYIAGFTYVEGKTIPALYTSLMGGFLGLTTMTESYGVGGHLIILALSLYSLLFAYGLICSCKELGQDVEDEED